MNRILFLFLVAMSTQLLAKNDDFIVCKSKFALCTTAACKRIPSKPGLVSCHCKVQEGYSVGMKPCTGVKKSKQGLALSSRYYPIKSFAICRNSRPWAWCLDSPCLIDPKSPDKASCLCSVVKNKGPYILVTKQETESTCTKGLYSSATFKDAEEISQYLKDHGKVLKPFHVKIFN